MSLAETRSNSITFTVINEYRKGAEDDQDGVHLGVDIRCIERLI